MTDSELRIALETHHSESYGWALSCCARSSVEAETVLQTVYLKVLMGKARYEGKASFKTWLFAVIRRTAADERRRQILRRLLLDRRLASPPLAQIERPDEAIHRAELQRLVREALAQLPRRQREVLQLVFYHDLSLAEAAQVMSVSLGSARTHYERGKKQLRRQMEGWQTYNETGIGREDDQSIVSATEAGR
ncbi:MAG TPA: RNA polymerase sigma factor [Blastocatellia bacterium]|jgi:RNA polymerase sigma-70 factor (ECF subfamily)|nr:RNA polymerase sigma factor [Blastocatellia bacterium]